MSETIDNLIDRFVEVVNSGRRNPVSIKESPSSVLVGPADELGDSDWLIEPCCAVDWIEQTEELIGMRFPNSYRSLITRYIFPGFEGAGVFFLANTPEGTDEEEFRTRLFSDRTMRLALCREGFLQFARPEDGMSYDPVCFDMNRGTNDDRPIVRIDHKYVLCDDVVKVTQEIAGSFRELIERFVDRH